MRPGNPLCRESLSAIEIRIRPVCPSAVGRTHGDNSGRSKSAAEALFARASHEFPRAMLSMVDVQIDIGKLTS